MKKFKLIITLVILGFFISCDEDADEVGQDLMEEVNTPNFKIASVDIYWDRVSIQFTDLFEFTDMVTSGVEVKKFGFNYGMSTLDQNIEFDFNGIEDILTIKDLGGGVTSTEPNPILINGLNFSTNYKFEGYFITSQGTITSETIEVTLISEDDIAVLGGVNRPLWQNSRVSFVEENKGYIFTWNSTTPIEFYLSSFDIATSTWSNKIIDNPTFRDLYFQQDDMISFTVDDRHFVGLGKNDGINPILYEVDTENAIITEVGNFEVEGVHDYFSILYQDVIYLLTATTDSIKAYSFDSNNNSFQYLAGTREPSDAIEVPTILDNKIYFLKSVGRTTDNLPHYTQHIFDPNTKQFSFVDFLAPLPLLEDLALQNHFELNNGNVIYMGPIFDDEFKISDTKNIYNFRHGSQGNTLLETLTFSDGEIVRGNIDASFMINGELHMISDLNGRHFALKIANQ